MWPGEIQPMLLTGSSCIPSFRSVATRVCLAKVPCPFFLVTMLSISEFFLAHVLSWVKTNVYIKFQRNLPICLARMDRQMDRQTDISLYISPIYISYISVCLSACLYYHSGQTCGWISLKLGMMIGFDPT